MKQIIGPVKSIAFTLAMLCFYNLDDCPRETKQIISLAMQNFNQDLKYVSLVDNELSILAHISQEI